MAYQLAAKHAGRQERPLRQVEAPEDVSLGLGPRAGGHGAYVQVLQVKYARQNRHVHLLLLRLSRF